MKGKIVLVQFPFDDLSGHKIRPAYCLTNSIGYYKHIIFALITSRIPPNPLDTDLIIDPLHSDFDRSGLIKSSTLRLDHLVTQWWDEKRAALKKDLAKASGITHLLQDKSKSLTLEDVWGDVLELTNSASLQK